MYVDDDHRREVVRRRSFNGLVHVNAQKAIDRERRVYSRARGFDTLKLFARGCTRLFESSAFEVVKSEPPPSVLDGVLIG